MANIRLKDLTSVENIADTDVIVIDGEAGTRVTTWAKMKELIKAQCGINELNTDMRNSWEEINIDSCLSPGIHISTFTPSQLFYNKYTHQLIGVIDIDTTCSIENQSTFLTLPSNIIVKRTGNIGVCSYNTEGIKARVRIEGRNLISSNGIAQPITDALFLINGII